MDCDTRVTRSSSRSLAPLFLPCSVAQHNNSRTLSSLPFYTLSLNKHVLLLETNTESSNPDQNQLYENKASKFLKYRYIMQLATCFAQLGGHTDARHFRHTTQPFRSACFINNLPSVRPFFFSELG